MVHRLDHLAKHADGLRARYEVDAFFSPVLFEGSLVENGGARNEWVSGFFSFLNHVRGFSVPAAVRIFGIPLVVTPSFF